MSHHLLLLNTLEFTGIRRGEINALRKSDLNREVISCRAMQSCLDEIGWLNEGSDGLPPSSRAFQASLSLASANQ
jgi:hypothetical protein